MRRGVPPLLAAQFLSAFGDNAILFAVIAMVLRASSLPAWYVPALQSAFLVAFVVLAPWVGRFADRLSKPHVLIVGNAVKAAGTLMILAGLEPIVAYAVVGIGAAIYGPAKYGVLPELVEHDDLVKANGLIEGSTIVAIVLGTVIGAKIADHSVGAALWVVVAAFALSMAVTLLMPRPAPPGVACEPALAGFAHRMRGFFETARARFSMLGAALFWAAAAVLRVLIVAWAPRVLGLDSASDVASLTLVLAIGIVAGAALAPRLVPMESLRRARLAGYALGLLVVALAATEALWPARVVLFLVGVAGGLFVVPVNATLQEIGHRSIGAGGAVAIQGFFENLGMLFAVGLYTFAAARGADPVASIVVLGAGVVAATLAVAWHLPAPPTPANARTGDSIER